MEDTHSPSNISIFKVKKAVRSNFQTDICHKNDPTQLCSWSESLLLSSMASLTALIGKLMEKVSMQRPKSNISLEYAKKNFADTNHDIWKTIYLFQSLSHDIPPPFTPRMVFGFALFS